jgi:hypothetical protein
MTRLYFFEMVLLTQCTSSLPAYQQKINGSKPLGIYITGIDHGSQLVLLSHLDEKLLVERTGSAGRVGAKRRIETKRLTRGSHSLGFDTGFDTPSATQPESPTQPAFACYYLAISIAFAFMAVILSVRTV